MDYNIISDASTGYDTLTLDKKSSYLITFVSQFDRYRFTKVPFGVALAGYMFPKINKIFKILPNVFGIADNILIVKNDADERDYDRTL